ncbi:hypothetical protein LSTR_LSTR016584 [Laodelphax striatellus]|uniref:Peptidase S1 domain-containing protein n=1 Tax=Laodelphax striatellus TaxID=195883 RepID=A0A482WPP1_LAOST|nr:hypothetical protein LSTR_LSTR016584 [Laodelphax striatellus]
MKIRTQKQSPTLKRFIFLIHFATVCGEIENQDRFEQGFRNSIETIDATQAPWNAAVYLADQNGTINMICGGTLISEEFIITAAKCVKDESGSVRNASVFRVALGKTFKDWNDPRDSEVAQKFQVEGILDEDFFKIFFSGNSEIIDFARHIVVLRVEGMVNFDTIVTHPVCLDIQRLNERIPNLIGTIQIDT